MKERTPCNVGLALACPLLRSRSQAMAMSPDLVAPQIGAVGSHDFRHKTPVDSLDRENSEDLSSISIRRGDFYLHSQASAVAKQDFLSLFKQRQRRTIQASQQTQTGIATHYNYSRPYTLPSPLERFIIAPVVWLVRSVRNSLGSQSNTDKTKSNGYN